MKEKISIVVPIYNVEKYLDRCIKSIVNQTYKNLEIILVDDGSPDNSPKMCDEWAKIDDRIKVIHKKNGGLSDARNAGIEKATGSYIGFVDSDDYIESDMYEKLYTAIKNCNASISQCGIRYVNSKEICISTKGYEKNMILSGETMISDYYGDHYIENVVVWNKMYQIDLFKKIKFPISKIHEDEYVTYKLLFDEPRISIIKDCLYDYRQTDNSIMRSSYNLKRLDVLDALKEKIEFFESKKANDNLIENAVLQYINFTRDAYYKVKKYYPKDYETLNRLRIEYEIYFKKYSKYKIINKFKNKLFISSPFIFGIFRKVKNILK